MKAPLVVFGYNRKKHLEETLNELNDNSIADQTELYIYLDGARGGVVGDQEKVDAVREYVGRFASDNRFQKVTIRESEYNKGLANSIIGGVSEIVGQYGKVIVVEDDLLTTPDFLQFMNDGLEFYENDKRIAMVTGYTMNLKTMKHYPKDVYLTWRGESWGWAIWKDRWALADWEMKGYQDYLHSPKLRKKFCRGGMDLPDMLKLQMEGKINSWAIRWCFAQSMYDLMTVCPKVTKVRNNGMDGTGEHCVARQGYDIDIGPHTYRLEKVDPDPRVLREIYRNVDMRYPARVRKSIQRRIENFRKKNG